MRVHKVLGIMLAAVATLFVVACIWLASGTGERVLWTAGNGEAVPDQFTYVMIPSGACEGLADRVYLHEQRELQSGAPIPVLEAADAGIAFDASCFMHLINGGFLAERTAATNAVITALDDESEYAGCETTVTPDADGLLVQLRIRYKSFGPQTFRYRVLNGVAQPLEWRARSSLGY